MLEKIVSFVIHKYECREVFYFDFPDGFHPEFWIFYAFNALDVVLCQYGCRSSDRSEIESSVFLACVGYSLASVSFCEHNHASSVALE